MYGQITNDAAQQALATAIPRLYNMHKTVLEERLPTFNYDELVPTNTDGDMWDVGTIITSTTAAVGRAEYMAGKGFDFPNVSSGTSVGTSNFHLAGVGYELSLQEVQRANKLGVDLNSRDARSARMVAEKFVYDRAMFGSAEKGFTGLINNLTVPAANAGSTWAAADADGKVAIVNEALTAVFTGTKETSLANTVLLPTSIFLSASTTRIQGLSMTVLAYLQANNAYTAITGKPLTFKPSLALETAGAGGSKRLMAYERDPQNMEFFLPGDFTFLPLFPISSMSWRVDGIMNVGQTEFYRPLAAAYRDNL